MKVKVQVVTITDDGQEPSKDIAWRISISNMLVRTVGSAPEQGCPSHGVSDRLRGAPCRQSPVHVSPTRPRVLVPWQRCCRNARPRACSTWNP